MVIEELTLTMPPSRVETFLARDGEVWTTFLALQPGFCGKEVWLPSDRPGTVVFIIRWETLEQWKAITPAQVQTVEAGMGELAADSLECRDYVVVG